MGRPLKKKYLGNIAKRGPQLYNIACWFDGEPEAGVGVVVRQASGNKFLMSDGFKETLCTLVDGPPEQPGEMQMTITPLGGSDENVKVLKTNYAHTFNGNAYRWQIDNFRSGRFNSNEGILSAAGEEPNLLDNLVAWFPMSELNSSSPAYFTDIVRGAIVKESVNTGLQIIDGVVGKSISFSAGVNNVECSGILQANQLPLEGRPTPISFFMWIYPIGTAFKVPLALTTRGPTGASEFIQLYSSGVNSYFVFRHYTVAEDGSIKDNLHGDTALTLVNNQWNAFGLSWNGRYENDAFRFFMNGTTTTANLGSWNIPAGQHYMGFPGKTTGIIMADLSGGQTGVESLDSYAIWNRELTQSDFNALYNDGNGTDYPGFSHRHTTTQCVLTVEDNDPFVGYGVSGGPNSSGDITQKTLFGRRLQALAINTVFRNGIPSVVFTIQLGNHYFTNIEDISSNVEYIEVNYVANGNEYTFRTKYRDAGNDGISLWEYVIQGGDTEPQAKTDLIAEAGNDIDININWRLK